MNVNHGLCPAKHSADTLRQIVQSIAMFGKDDQLAAMSFGIKHFRIVLKQTGKSLPFSIRPAAAHGKGELLQRGKQADLNLEFGISASGRSLFNNSFISL